MTTYLQTWQHGRLGWITAVLAGLPFMICCLAGSTLPETTPLHRTGTTQRPLQFARYCVNHGRDPVLHTATLNSHFRFRNIGAKTIQIGEIERSCGCLTPQLSHRQLKPGETGDMVVSVPLAEQSAGFHEYQLTVHYSDPKPRHETVLIKAVFPEPQIHVTPRAMDVSQTGSVDRPLMHQFSVTDNRSTPLRVTAVESSSPWVHGKVESVHDNGRLTQIALEIQGDLPPGTHRTLVHALTNDPQFPAAVMPIRIRGPARTQPVTVLPSRLRMLADDPTPQAVRLQLPADWKVSHVECFPDELWCEWQAVRSVPESNQQSLELALVMSAPPASRAREGVVTVYANRATEMVTVSVEILGGSQRRDAAVAQPDSDARAR